MLSPAVAFVTRYLSAKGRAELEAEAERAAVEAWWLLTGMLPTSVDLYNLAEDPYEQNNVAAAHPDKVAALQARLEAASKEAAKPLALLWIFQTAMKSAIPLLPTDEGAYTDNDADPTPPKIGTGH